MRIAVLSGKGGAGKTLVAVNLASAAGRAVYVDCDVEEPNGCLFWKPENGEETTVSTLLPTFDSERCTGCRACVKFCRFHALIYIKDKPQVFSEVCHSCGGCAMVCPEKAISQVKKPVGHLEQGWHGSVRVVTGVLNPGEASGVPVIRAALDTVTREKDLVVVDCPPGSACSVVESVSDADYCVLVAEPTAFGFHNFQMVYELATLLGKPCGVVINKQDTSYAPLEDFCRDHHLPILARIAYSPEYARMIADGKILGEENREAGELFRNLLDQIGGKVR